MRLLDLEPRLVRREIRIEPKQRIRAEVFAARPQGPYTEADIETVVGPVEYHVYVATIAEADGIFFLCPKCFRTNGGPRRTHSIVCWRPRVPQAPNVVGPGRWEFHGTGLGDLSLVMGSSSVQLTGGCNAHFLVQLGQIQFLDEPKG